jgi:hypothetical protein
VRAVRTFYWVCKMGNSHIAAVVSLYLHPYFTFNALAVLAYGFARTHFMQNFDERYTRLKAPQEIVQWVCERCMCVLPFLRLWLTELHFIRREAWQAHCFRWLLSR